MATSPTKPSTRRLSEVARHVVIPSGIVTTGWPAVEAKAAELGIHFDPWQQGAGRIILGKRADGKYAATIGGVKFSIPRQVGKTFLVGVIVVVMCILFPDLKVVWTAHRTRTATNTFRSLQGMARRRKVAPHISHIRTANGEQEIGFRNGSVIMFGAREQGFGRGFDEVDIEVFDEDQILTEKALSGKAEDMVYIEFSADPDANPDDRAQWAKANPSYPHRTPLESMLRLRENLMSDDAWKREALGIWDEITKTLAVIPAELWHDRRTFDPPEQDVPPVALAVDRWHDGTTAVAGAWLQDDGHYLELLALDVAPDPRRSVEWIAERAGRRIPVLIAADSPAASMVPNLVAARVKVKLVSGPDFARACQAFVDDALGEGLTHANQEQVNDALAAATKLPVGKAGAWVWDRRAPDNDISSLVAATLAHHGASLSQKRKSNKASGRRVVTV